MHATDVGGVFGQNNLDFDLNDTWAWDGVVPDLCAQPVRTRLVGLLSQMCSE